MRKIYEHNFWYTALRPYVDLMTKTCFREVTVIGEHNIPEDGAVIYAPNHCNTLMDALVVLQAHTEPVVFGARADIFNNPAAASALRFLRILPITRMRDSLRLVERNRAIMDEVAESLENNVKYCLFGEGTHRTKHSLLPIRKGVIRTAITAHERFGDRKPVYVVPVGLEYGDYFRFRTSVRIAYGEPINVTRYLADNPDKLESDIYKELASQLADGIASLITYLPDDHLYDGRWMITKIAGKDAAMSADESTIEEARLFDIQRREEQISLYSFGHRHHILRTLGKLLIWIGCLPVFAFCALASAPMTIAAQIIRKGIKDKAFTNTVRFATKFALLVPMIAVWALVLFIFLPWKAALPLFVLALFSHSIYYELREYTRRLISDIRFIFGHKSLKARYNQLAGELLPRR